MTKDLPNEVLEILGVEKYTPILSKKMFNLLFGALVALLIFLLAIFVNIKSEYNKKPIQVNFASGMLSSSIFDSQNTNIIDNYTEHASFNDIDYIVGVPSSSIAEVDSGQAFQINDDYVAFISEFKPGTDISSLLIAQLGKIYLLNVDETKCSVQPYIRESGYINGYAADYRADALFITDNEVSYTVYVEGYEIKLSNEHRVFISTASMEAGRKAFEIMRDEARSMVYTLAYSEELAEERAKEREVVNYSDTLRGNSEVDETKISNFAKKGTIVDADDDNSSVANNLDETTQDVANESASSTNSEDSGIKTTSIMISTDVDFTASKVTFRYTNIDATITNAVVTDLDGNKMADGEVIEPGVIEFANADYKKGSYLIVVMSENAIGDCSSKFGE